MDFCLDPSFHRVLESPGNYDFFYCENVDIKGDEKWYRSEK